jgi:dTDP-4-amino-4,6-dideoxygalactose transaminase
MSLDPDKSFIPFSLPTLEDEEMKEIVDTVRSGWITAGPRVAKLEADFQKWLSRPHAISVTSATAGLHLVMHALKLSPNDEVITTAMTWPSTVNMIELTGGRPVFADIHPDTLEIDVAEIERKLTPRTRAIIPVHYGGQPCDLDKMAQIVGNRPIHIIEDAAHALGAAYKGHVIGSSSNIAIFSFHPIKGITTGEGGMIVCSDEAMATKLRRLRFHGVLRSAWQRYKEGGNPQYDVEEPGFKYNMTDLQAALGVHQLTKLERFNQARTQLALRYRKLLSTIPEITTLRDVPYPATNSWHLFVIQLDLRALTICRDEFVAELGAEKIGTGMHFLAVHLQTYYRHKYGYKRGDLPHTEAASDSIFSLPLYPLFKEEEQDRVVETLRKHIKKNRR